MNILTRPVLLSNEMDVYSSNEAQTVISLMNPSQYLMILNDAFRSSPKVANTGAPAKATLSLYPATYLVIAISQRAPGLTCYGR